MAPRSILKGMNTRPQRPKAVTPLQKQLQDLEKRDLAHAEASNKIEVRRLKQEKSPSPPPLDHDAMEQDLPRHLATIDSSGKESEDPDAPDEAYVINPDHFMPRAPPPSEPDDNEDENQAIMVELRKQQRFDDRLRHEERWTWQHAVMLPTFLRYRLETLNWGHSEKWNHDFRQACNCPSKTERDVDLLDLHSQCIET